MATKDTVVPELVVNTLTQAQFDAAKKAGTLSPYELYGTPDASVRLPVLTPMWFDHIVNDVSWLRAETFSWHSDDKYKAVYEHLADDYENAEDETSLYELDLTSPDKVYEDGSAVTIVGYVHKLAVGEKVFDRAQGTATIKSLTLNSVDSQSIESMTLEFDTGEVIEFYGYAFYQSVIGSVDEANGEYIFYRLTEDGHKICMPDQESKIAALYEATGAADYYLLDTTNKQFKLPRKQKRRLIQAVKNIDGTWYNLYSDGWVEQGGIASGNTGVITLPIEMAHANYVITDSPIGRSGYNYHIWETKEITTTSFHLTIAGSEYPVTARMWCVRGYAAESAYASSGMNLEYYYVGNFTQDAVEQTAGLNAELFNGKLDIELSNANDATKSTVVGWGIPDYSAGVSFTPAVGTTFTAPTDGVALVYFRVSGGNGNLVFNSTTIGLFGGSNANHNNFSLPMNKGDTITITMNAGAVDNSTGIFYPLKGAN